jgi:hypothetical protein
MRWKLALLTGLPSAPIAGSNLYHNINGFGRASLEP